MAHRIRRHPPTIVAGGFAGVEKFVDSCAACSPFQEALVAVGSRLPGALIKPSFYGRWPVADEPPHLDEGRAFAAEAIFLQGRGCPA